MHPTDIGACIFAGAASQKLVEAARSHTGSLTVIASGPLTNVAHALQLDPHFVTNGVLHGRGKLCMLCGQFDKL